MLRLFTEVLQLSLWFPPCMLQLDHHPTKTTNHDKLPLFVCVSITNHFQAFSLKYHPFFYWSYDFHHFLLHFGCVWQSRGFQYTGGCGDDCCDGLLGAYLLGRRIQKARIIRRQHSWSSGHLNVRVFRWRIQIREGAVFVLLVCLVPNEIPWALVTFSRKSPGLLNFGACCWHSCLSSLYPEPPPQFFNVILRWCLVAVCCCKFPCHWWT